MCALVTVLVLTVRDGFSACIGVSSPALVLREAGLRDRRLLNARGVAARLQRRPCLPSGVGRGGDRGYEEPSRVMAMGNLCTCARATRFFVYTAGKKLGDRHHGRHACAVPANHGCTLTGTRDTIRSVRTVGDLRWRLLTPPPPPRAQVRAPLRGCPLRCARSAIGPPIGTPCPEIHS